MKGGCSVSGSLLQTVSSTAQHGHLGQNQMSVALIPRAVAGAPGTSLRWETAAEHLGDGTVRCMNVKLATNSHALETSLF